MSADEVRAAYRRLLLANHPDVSTGPDAAARTDRIVAAYAALRTTSEPPVVDPPAIDPDTIEPDTIDPDTIAIDAPPDEAFFLLLDAAHRVGDVTHVDPEAGLLETLVRVDGVVCSLVVSLQGRATGITEAFCTLTPLDGSAPPAAGPVVEALARHIR